MLKRTFRPYCSVPVITAGLQQPQVTTDAAEKSDGQKGDKGGLGGFRTGPKGGSLAAFESSLTVVVLGPHALSAMESFVDPSIMCLCSISCQGCVAIFRQ